MEEMAECGNVDSAPTEETKYAATGTGERSDTWKQESGYDKKKKHVPEEVTGATTTEFILKEVLEIFHDIGSSKDKMLEADPSLERSLRI